MSDEKLANSPAYQLAHALQAVEDTEQEYAEVKADFRERLTRLHNEVALLKQEILTGQKRLPLEPIGDAVADLVAPIDGKGITSMSMEIKGQPESKVTITAEDAKHIRKNLGRTQ